MQRWMWSLLAATSLVGGVSFQAVAATAPAPAEGAQKQKVHFAQVAVNKKQVLRLADTKDRRAQERADEVRERLRMTLSPKKGEAVTPVKDSELLVTTVVGQPVIRFRNQNVIDVTPQDAALNGIAQEALAQRWAADLRSAIRQIKVAKGQPIAAGAIVVTTGVIDVPKTATMGGGGGGKPKHKPTPKPTAKPKK